MRKITAKHSYAIGLAALALAGAVLPHATRARTPTAETQALAALHFQDQRLAAIASALLEKNAALCNETMPSTGLVLHSSDQYGSGLSSQLFPVGPLSVASVVEASPSDQAGVRAGDTITAVGQTPITALPPLGKQPLRDAAFQEIANHSSNSPLALTILRDGKEMAVSISPHTACRALVEITADNGINALSDGRVIHISYGLAAQASDAELAVIFAHEMGHLVLEHRRRLASEGVSKGLLGEFGKSQRLNRAAEIEADQISVHLLHNAGFAPAIAPQFWRGALGRKVSGGILRMSRIYPNANARAQLMDQEIAEHLSPAPHFNTPAHLLAGR